MKKYLGVDQSYASCAWVVTTEDCSVIEYGIIKSDKTADIFNRALFVALELSSVISRYEIDQLNIEGLAFAMRGDSTRDLAGLLFTIVAVMNINHSDLTRVIVPPTSLKKFATGSGKSDKKEMIAALPPLILDGFSASGFKKTTGLSDLADAYWLSVSGRQ